MFTVTNRHQIKNQFQNDEVILLTTQYPHVSIKVHNWQSTDNRQRGAVGIFQNGTLTKEVNIAYCHEFDTIKVDYLESLWRKHVGA